MKTLQHAYRQILNYWPEFGQIKETKGKPDDILKVVRCLRGQDTVLWPRGITAEECIQREKLLKDPTITKLYCSDKMVEKFKYLAFIQLGIQYLEQHNAVEATQIGQVILAQKLAEERTKLWPPSSKD